MGKLTQMVNQTIIDGFKGKVDFYYYMGVPCYRKWPKKPTGPTTPAVKASQEVFKTAVALWNELSLTMKDYYNKMAEPTNLTGKDLFFRSYISGILRLYEPVDDLEGE